MFVPGATLAVIIDMDHRTSVIFSACVAVFYTLFGGLYSVAYTDVIQLFCIFIGLWMCIPFAWANEHVKPLSSMEVDWIGKVESNYYWFYIDYGLLLVFGGIPWQVYFQRVLSSKTAGRAQILSYVAAFGCIIMAIPPVLIGAIAKGTAWNETDYRGELTADGELTSEQTSMILPLVLQHLTPDFVSFFGLGAVSAAVMSSADSSVLSASSMFARNVYKLIFRQNASEMEIIWVMRVSILVVGALATLMALTIPSIYGLWRSTLDIDLSLHLILTPHSSFVTHLHSHTSPYNVHSDLRTLLRAYVITSYALDKTFHAICYHHVENQRGSLVKQHCLSTHDFARSIRRQNYPKMPKPEYDGSRCTTPVRLAIILPTNAASEITGKQTMSMCSDLVYVILFPQLLMVVHFKKYCNTYGSLAAYIVALLVRLSGGEKLLGLPAFIHYPGWDAENEVQLFPFRTMAMSLSLFTLAFISWLSVNVCTNTVLQRHAFYPRRGRQRCTLRQVIPLYNVHLLFTIFYLSPIAVTERATFPIKCQPRLQAAVISNDIVTFHVSCVRVDGHCVVVRRFLFNGGYLSPESDYFNCVVNIPEDIRRVDEPSEAGEQMSVLGGVPGRLYGAASTLVGPDEKCGRINPALEPDDDDLDDPNDGPTPLFGSSSAPPPVQPFGKQTAF
ncbi:hypothetical protein SFRURICE_003064 [Spodoptera frugiperda]|nr:hypothetical protein SFRURICE_003064 [Spodoptera frugiperda]